MACPKCGSGDVEKYNYSGVKVIKCNNCGFDEGEEYESYPNSKTSQKAKGNYNIYKSGGSRRQFKGKK